MKNLHAPHGLVGIEELSSLHLIGVSDISALSTLRTAGHLTIDSTDGTVGAFDSLQEIRRVLTLSTPPLGLFPSLRSVGENVEIQGARSSLDGLGTLEHIGGNLAICRTSLVDFSGLEGLQSVDGSLLVYNNPSLVSFDGLGALSRVGRFYVQESQAIDTRALRALSLVGGDFTLETNASQESLAGLGSLTTIDGSLVLNQTGLANLEDFGSMAALGGDLHVPRSMDQPDEFLGALEHFTGEVLR